MAKKRRTHRKSKKLGTSKFIGILTKKSTPKTVVPNNTRARVVANILAHKLGIHKSNLTAASAPFASAYAAPAPAPAPVVNFTFDDLMFIYEAMKNAMYLYTLKNKDVMNRLYEIISSIYGYFLDRGDKYNHMIDNIEPFLEDAIHNNAPAIHTDWSYTVSSVYNIINIIQVLLSLEEYDKLNDYDKSIVDHTQALIDEKHRNKIPLYDAITLSSYMVLTNNSGIHPSEVGISFPSDVGDLNIYKSNSLKAFDTFHDFWKPGRITDIFKNQRSPPISEFEGILHNIILYSIVGSLLTSKQKGVVNPYLDENTYDKYNRAQYILNTITSNNPVLATPVVKLSNIEIDGAYNFIGISTPTPAVGKNKETYNTMITTMFPDYGGQNVYIVCDSGPGFFGALGSFKGSKLRQIITQCTVADSANTPSGKVGDTTLLEAEGESGVTLYLFVPNSGDVFLSDSNLFTKNDNYSIFYSNDGFNENISNITLNITIPEVQNFRFPFINSRDVTKSATQGSPAGMLAGYAVYSYLNSIGAHDTPLAKNIRTSIINYNKNKYRKKILKLEIDDNNLLCDEHGINPGLFLDIKRGGDRDQVVAAIRIRDTFDPAIDKLVFCTGDLLCATIAVNNGLATVYQSPSSASIQYWPETRPQPDDNPPIFGGNKKGMNGGNSISTKKAEQTTKTKSDDFLYNITDFIKTIAAIAVNSLRSKISTLYPEICRLSSLNILRNQIKLFYKTTPQTQIDKYKAIKNSKYYIDFSLENALNSFRKINNNKDVVTLKEIINDDKEIVLQKVEQEILKSEKSIKTDYKNSTVKNKIINDIDFDEGTVMLIRSVIEKDWESNPEFMKIMTVPSNKKIYTQFKELIYADLSKSENRNSYSRIITSLSLFNDFINNNILTQCSVVSKLIYGTSPVKYKWELFTPKSLNNYLTLFKNIYNNYKTSADFMNVVPESLKATVSVRANKTKLNQQTRKNIQGRRNNTRRQQQSMRKNISSRPLIPISQQQPTSIAVSGGKRRTHKRHRRHHKKLHTRRRK